MTGDDERACCVEYDTNTCSRGRVTDANVTCGAGKGVVRGTWREDRTRGTVTKAIDELNDKGLIDIVRQGAGTYKQTSVYGFSDRWEKWHPEATYRRHNGFVDKPRPRKPRHPGFKKGRP